MSATGAESRAGAARVLEAVLGGGRSLRAALATELPRHGDARDRALIEAIVFEALRRRRRYQAHLDALLERPMPKRTAPIGSLLLAGLAQLDGLGLAEHAAIDASAEAARRLRQPRLVGLVNAVLRRFLREREALDRAADEAAARHHEHPDWLREALVADWGESQAASVLAAGNAAAPMWLRVNAQRASRAEVQAALAEAGIEAEAPAMPDSALSVAPRSPTLLPGWNQGWLSVQDAAAQCCAPLLDPRPGMRVLDACAAPGGKAAHLLERAPGIALLALDSDARRLERVSQTLARLGLEASLELADAGDPASWWDGRAFDRILLDAPCTATGIIRRQPDIKWHRQPGDVEALAAQQRRLLDALWPLLAPGGRLGYATCSVLRDENARQIDAFLARHADARAVDLELPHGRRDGAGWQILPGEGGMDGFFHAVLERAR